jgi:hypothetical protein
MPSKSPKQQQFFKDVVAVQNGGKSPSSYVTKVANQVNPVHARHFANALSEKVDLRDKKAIVAMLKDIVEPMYLNEEDEEQDTMDAVATTFHKKEVWAKYVRMYVGQPLSPKEVESLGNFKEKKPTKIARTEIWYNTTDSFGSSHTSVIKKMKDSGQFSFIAFQKQERVEPDKEEKPGAEDLGGGGLPDLGGMPMGGAEQPMGGTTPIAPIGELTEPPTTNDPAASTTTSTGDVPSPDEKQSQEEEKDDIIVTKSILFKDEIKGAAILVEFLKKLNL